MCQITPVQPEMRPRYWLVKRSNPGARKFNCPSYIHEWFSRQCPSLHHCARSLLLPPPPEEECSTTSLSRLWPVPRRPRLSPPRPPSRPPPKWSLPAAARAAMAAGSRLHHPCCHRPHPWMGTNPTHPLPSSPSPKIAGPSSARLRGCLLGCKTAIGLIALPYGNSTEECLRLRCAKGHVTS